MGREHGRDADQGAGRTRRRHHRGESHDWKTRADGGPHSLPRRREAQVQRSGARTSRTRPEGPSSLDATETTMPPPRRHGSPTDAYRRPRQAVAYDEEHVSGRRHSRRDLSPDYDYRRRHRPAEFSPSPSPSEESADDRDLVISDRESSDERRTIADEVDEISRERRSRQPAADDYMESSDERRRHRRRRHEHRYSDHEDHRRLSASDLGSPGRRPPRTYHSHEPHRRSRHRPVADIIEDSRPPVASKRPSKRALQTTEVVYRDARPRRSNTVTSGRSSRSSSRRPSSILGGLFGGPPPRRPSPEKPAKLVECVVCMGDIPSTKAAKLKCGHRMCHSCLQRSFRLSITDPQHMPPKCCTADHIPLKHVERLFDMSFKKTWNHKFAEYSTRNRIYCPSKKCGEWIKPANIRRENGRKVARCARCKTKVCGTCNAKWHQSAECPKDEETNQFLEQAKEEGWQRCYKCKAMVELKEGCNHMTCRCGAQFCMICAVKWKNCDCPWFNYDNVEPDRLHMNVPMPHIRGDLDDIFDGDGPPTPAELRGMGPRGMPMRPQGYEEEMHMRRLQEQDDEEMARRMEMYGGLDDDDESDDYPGGPGNVMGVGNAAGHYMNDDYRRAAHRGPVPPTPGSPAYDRGPDYVADVNRARGMRGGSMERRLADRLSENRRPRPAMSPHRVPPLMGNPMAAQVGMGMPPAPPAPAPMLRPPLAEDDVYSNAANTPRSERVVPARISRRYEDEAEVHAPRSRRRREEEAPKGSAMAGLNGHGRGLNRIFEWRTFVEPGVPDGEATTTVEL